MKDLTFFFTYDNLPWLLFTEKEVDQLMCELFEAYGGADILDDDTQESEMNIPTPLELIPQLLLEQSNGTTLIKEEAKARIPSSTDDGEDTSDGMGGGTGQPYPGHLSPLKYVTCDPPHIILFFRLFCTTWDLSACGC